VPTGVGPSSFSCAGSPRRVQSLHGRQDNHQGRQHALAARPAGPNVPGDGGRRGDAVVARPAFGSLGARSRPPAGRIGFNASTGGRRANGSEQLCTLRAEPSVRAGGAAQECCGRPSRRSRSTSCVAFVHRVGYSIGYTSGAPRLRHVHDVRFRLFMRRRYRGPRRIHSHRPREVHRRRGRGGENAETTDPYLAGICTPIGSP
jgi:hypothetical protein